MIRRRQLYLHQPENDIQGDCHRTAIACLLDLEPHQVPHFGQLCVVEPGYEWKPQIAKFLASHGMFPVDVAFGPGVELESVLAHMAWGATSAYYLLGGRSPRGTNHTVIGCGGTIAWDPHPDGSGVVAPLDNGYFEITFLLPLSMRFTSAPEVEQPAGAEGE